jgi:hypothetical protein
LASALLQQPLTQLNFKIYFKSKKPRKGLFCWHRINSVNTTMEVKRITEITIYESPDGGRTVYARRPGSNHRELHMRDPELDKEIAELKNQERWQEILAARTDNPALNELLEQVEILYELSKKAQ